jgi:hypothetical protein
LGGDLLAILFLKHGAEQAPVLFQDFRVSGVAEALEQIGGTLRCR